MSRLLPLLAAAAMLALLPLGCKDEPAPAPAAGAGERTSPDDAAAAPPPEVPAQRPDPSPGSPLLGALEAAGFALAPEVPFDDQGALPAPIADGTAPGLVGSDAWVLRRTRDEAWVQVFVARFATVDEARAASGDALLRGSNLIWVIPFDGAPSELRTEVERALSP